MWTSIGHQTELERILKIQLERKKVKPRRLNSSGFIVVLLFSATIVTAHFSFSACFLIIITVSFVHKMWGYISGGYDISIKHLLILILLYTGDRCLVSSLIWCFIYLAAAVCFSKTLANGYRQHMLEDKHLKVADVDFGLFQHSVSF